MATKTKKKTPKATQTPEPEAPTFKPGDLIRAGSGRTYRIEKVLKDGKLKGREAKKGTDELTGPMRSFRPGNVEHLESPAGVKALRRARKRVKLSTRIAKHNDAAPPSGSTKHPGCLAAAVDVLQACGAPMSCKAIMEAILERGLWSTRGSTPSQTLSSAIQREIKTKKKASRFIKTQRGLYALNPATTRSTGDQDDEPDAGGGKKA